jgi:hypothetical protein
MIAIPLGVAAVITCIATESSWGPSLARARGVRYLTRAGSLAELKEAVGPLGVVLVLPERDWVAIHYEDSHRDYATWSQAVALDSGGNWYESQTHFCGHLGCAYQDLEGRRKSLEEERSRNPEDWPPKPKQGYLFYQYHLLAIQEAKNLEEARGHLEVLGFTQMGVAGAPRLRGPLPDA